MGYDPNNFADFEALYASVSRMPEIIDFAGFDQAMREHKNSLADHQRVSGQVLVSISISDSGEVLGAAAVTPTLPKGVSAIAVCIGEDGVVHHKSSSVTEDPVLIAKAVALCKQLRFRPAERNGQTVAFPDFRFGIEF